MRITQGKLKTVALIVSCLMAGVSCAHKPSGGLTKWSERQRSVTAYVSGLEKAKNVEMPVLLRLKADAKRTEKVAYAHRSRTTNFEDSQVRQQKDEALDFVSQAETLKVEDGGQRFTQNIKVISKLGTGDLHDFAMPELGENLVISADSQGRILRSGDYPDNSIFYVPPISLPEAPVAIGDTWTMQASWLSLGEMVPYQLDMVSILKGFWNCGSHRCAEIEIAGEVVLQGPLAQAVAFRSLWRGFTLLDIDAGTVVWSRVDSEEQFMSGNVRRSISSCLESSLNEPSELRLPRGKNDPAACAVIAEPGDIAPTPAAVLIQ